MSKIRIQEAARQTTDSRRERSAECAHTIAVARDHLNRSGEGHQQDTPHTRHEPSPLDPRFDTTDRELRSTTVPSNGSINVPRPPTYDELKGPLDDRAARQLRLTYGTQATCFSNSAFCADLGDLKASRSAN